MSETIEFSELLPCGHHRSLLVKSVESGYTFCELCETKSQLRDALKQERELLDENRDLKRKLKEAALLQSYSDLAASSGIVGAP